MNYKISCLLLFAILLVGQKSLSQKSSKPWTGHTMVESVAENFSWFNDGYNDYRPDTATIHTLSKSLEGYHILVFAGTWCPDTQKLLPDFYKTTDAAGISHDKIDLYLLNRKKKSRKKLEQTYHIQSIPTFILLKDGNEVGRIVESVNTSMETDLLNLTSH